MSDNIGQIPDEVDQLAADFEAKAGELEDLKTHITGKLASTVWTGNDRDRFEADWQGAFSQNITQIIQQLRQAAQIATHNAQEQRDASNS